MHRVTATSADFSPCGRWRYTLRRSWAPGRAAPARRDRLLIIALNPSTADAERDDPTIRRCIGFAQAWGFQALCVVNLFAWRATLPADLKAAADPVGPDNDAWLRQEARRAGLVLAAWGVHGVHQGRDAAVRAMLPALHCLRRTRDGHPAHPLYLPKTLRPVPMGRGE